MRRNRFILRLESALEKSRRRNPDGALATYAWMWRVLVRSSGSSVGLYARFVRIVSIDLILLGGWAICQPLRHLLARRRGRITVGASVAMAAVLVVFLSRPTTPAPTPWSGAPTIELHSNGLLRFEGQLVRDDDVRKIVDHYGVREASVTFDKAATASRVVQVTELLSSAGVEHVLAEAGDRSPGSR